MVLYLIEKSLNQVSLLVYFPVIVSWLAAPSWWDNCLRAVSFDERHQGFRIVGFVRYDVFHLPTFNKTPRWHLVVGLASAEEYVYWKANIIHARMYLARKSATRSAYSLSCLPPFAPEECW